MDSGPMFWCFFWCKKRPSSGLSGFFSKSPPLKHSWFGCLAQQFLLLQWERCFYHLTICKSQNYPWVKPEKKIIDLKMKQRIIKCHKRKKPITASCKLQAKILTVVTIGWLFGYQRFMSTRCRGGINCKVGKLLTTIIWLWIEKKQFRHVSAMMTSWFELISFFNIFPGRYGG